MEPRDIRDRAPSGSSAVNAWLVALLVLLVGVLTWRSVADLFARPRVVTPRGDLAEDEKSTIELFKAVSPSVVHVTTLAAADGLQRRGSDVAQGTGSGFVWDDGGHVVTNFHVIYPALQNEGRITVALADNTTFPATVVGYAAEKDLAVLKINPGTARLRPVDVGESSNLQVGQKVFAIGSPFNLDQTLTTGVISGLGREIQSMTQHPISEVIQTDAAINPGNSGGPLLDSAGRLIGVNTAIYKESAGIGFAVPVDIVNRVVPQLIRTGRYDRVGLGVRTLDDAAVERLVDNGVLPRKGVVIAGIVPGGGAEKAGLKPGVQTAQGIEVDLIVGIDDKPIETMNDLYRALDGRNPGDTVSVSLIRDGKPVKTEVTLQVLPSGAP